MVRKGLGRRVGWEERALFGRDGREGGDVNDGRVGGGYGGGGRKGSLCQKVAKYSVIS